MKVKFLPIKKQLTALAALLVGFPAMLSLVGMYVAPHDIKGVVYRDFDANGTRQSTTTYAEPGVPGVTVTAYAANGTQAAQTTTGADGTYTLDIAAAGDYRVEFTGLQTGDFSGAFGTGSGTSVQFVSGGAENVNLGINYPAQYSSSKNPRVITSGFIAGTPTGGNVGHDHHTLWTVPFNANGTQTAATGTERRDISQSKQLGSVWGIAYGKKSKTTYVAAFTKRHVGFGSGGAGAIYKVPLNSDQTAALSAPTVLYTFPAAAVGTSIHGTLNNDPGQATRDNAAFDNVGKTSLGDIDISDDEKKLYAISLADRKLNIIDLTKPTITSGDVTSFSIPAPVFTPAPDGGITWRPFALKYYRGKVYVGVTVTNEGSYTNNNIDNKGNSTGMRGIVYEFDGTNFTQVLEFPLNYKRQPNGADQTPETNVARGHYWRPWTSIYRTDRGSLTGGGIVTYAQPWLTDIEFDVNGEMILGIRDRWGDQMGYQNYRPEAPIGPGGTTSGNQQDQNDTRLWSAIAPGEVLRAGKVSLTNNAWAIENRGAVTHLGVTTARSDDQKKQFGPGGAGGTTYSTSPSTVGVTSADYFNRIVSGNVEGKYYWGDVVGVSYNHGSSHLGGLALLPGSNKLIMTSMDPTDIFNTGGLKRLHNGGTGFVNNRSTAATPGSADDSQHYDGTGSAPGPDGAGARKGVILYDGSPISWGKANGMGEVELLTDPAPIEIGNRIWRDTDSDGIQDAGEAGIEGVTVELVDEAGTVVATAVTDANGNYIFSSDPTGTSTTALKYNLPLVYGAKYKVRVPNVSGGSKQAALGTDQLTQANQGGANPIDDTRDSDGLPSGSHAETALFTLGDAGENDHTHDFGFTPLGALGDYVWIDTDSDGVQDAGEEGVNDVTVTLYKWNPSTSTYDPYGTPQQTRDNPNDPGKKGYYWFDDLPSGQYKVRFTDIPDNYKLTSADQGGDDAADSDADGDGWSQAVTIDTSKPLDNLERINPTIDAGIVPLGALGDYVWFDNDSDGVQDDDEVGVNNVTVTLYKKNDLGEFVPYGVPQQTGVNPNDPGKNGYYWFGDLPSGEYQVGFSDLPPGYGFTDQNLGGDDAEDSDADPVTGRSQTVTIDTSKPITDLERINPTIDAGIVPVGSIGDYVWFDTDTDGEQDVEEEGVDGVTVQLYVWEGDELTGGYVLKESTVTATKEGKKGYYNFPNLKTGKYKVKFVKPSGNDFTHVDKAGVDDTKDSDANRTTGESGDINIDTSLPVDNIGRNNPTIDAGLVPEGALPVKLVQFGAVKEGATAKISWRTTSEVNASHFEVQRSADARTWVKIGTVAATGSEKTGSRYTFTDGTPVRGLNFYRLRTVDLDGTSESSNIVSLDFAKGVAEAAYVYPNPASESIRFSSDLDLSRVRSVSVTDVRGNVVYTAGSIAAEGISATRFKTGLHIIRVRMVDGTTRDFKVVIEAKK